jgi:hypothetical protein
MDASMARTIKVSFLALLASCVTYTQAQNGPIGSKRRQELIEMTLVLNSQHFDAKAQGEPYASARSAVDQCSQSADRSDNAKFCARAFELTRGCNVFRDDWYRRKAVVLAESVKENIVNLIPALPRMEIPACPVNVEAAATGSDAARKPVETAQTASLLKRNTNMGKNYFEETVAKAERGESVEFIPAIVESDSTRDDGIGSALLALAGGYAQGAAQAQAMKGDPRAAAVLAQSQSRPGTQVNGAAANSLHPVASNLTLPNSTLPTTSRRRHSGAITEHCVKYNQLQLNDLGWQYFEFVNGCSETIQIWHTTGSNKYSRLSIVKSGAHDKNWYSTTGPYAQSRILYFACRETEQGERVSWDEKANECYYTVR